MSLPFPTADTQKARSLTGSRFRVSTQKETTPSNFISRLNIIREIFFTGKTENGIFWGTKTRERDHDEVTMSNEILSDAQAS